MGTWGAEEVAAAVSGGWIAEPKREMRGATIDSREVEDGNIFFALRGENTDGHRFLQDAADRGAGAVVIEDRTYAAFGGQLRGCGVLLVDDVRAALHAMALAWRARLHGRVIGVTGSNGKTSTVRMIDAAISGDPDATPRLRGSRSVRSYNNDLGVPLTLLNAAEEDDYVVCEIGMSGPGEIAPLAHLAWPDAVVITSIGRAHLEAFGSIGRIAVEKASILSGLSSDGIAFVCDGVPDLDAHIDDVYGDVEVVRFGLGRRARPRIISIGPGERGARFVFDDGADFESPLPGDHNALNAAAAVAVARWVGVPDASIRAGLARAETPPMRLEPAEVVVPGGVALLINDAYNANPESVLAAMEMLATGRLDPPGAARRRRVALLGEMLELGGEAEAAHREIGARVAGLEGIDALWCVGPSAGVATGAAQLAGFGGELRDFPGATEPALTELGGGVRAGDVVLIKGSRGVRLERFVELLRAAGRTRSAAG
ncbi:MAG: UDP-N-acetylmuramoyl-tripeptide--D-alanyl-D-alanine ligase [Planctomycetota bacterium]